jgi:site-specific recombinase XerC
MSAERAPGGRDRGLIDRYLAMLAAERGAARNTLLAYRGDLEDAAAVLPGLAEADAEALGALSRHWAELSPASLARKGSALRGFFAFLEAEGVRADNPSAGLVRPVLRRPLPKVLSHGDVDALFAAIAKRTEGDRPRPPDLRLAALVELLYGSGLRATELVSLPARAVTTDRPYLILRGKGGICPRACSGCSRPASRISAACACSSSFARWRLKRGSIRRGSARMCCAMPSRPICSRAAPICARCRRCSAMPTSPPPRSTRMSTPPGSSRWSMPAIRSLTSRTAGLNAR